MYKWKRVAAVFSFAVFGFLSTNAATGGEARAAQASADSRPVGGATVVSPAEIFSGVQKNPSSLSIDVRGMQREIKEKGFATVYIEFATNSAEILPESVQQVKNIGALLQEETAWRLQIVGHTDSTGDAAYNLDLSRKRAVSVQQALLDLGIAAERLTAEGMGEEKPVADNKTPEGRARNRRVELIKAD